MRSIFTLVACLACAAAMAGEVYKWTDKDGRVHYGDRPKAGGEEVEIRGTGGKGPRLFDPAERQVQSAHDAECQRKKAQLDTYRKAPSISETDNLGRTHEYSEEERKLFLQRYEQETATACAPQAATK